jgi:ribose/xylose/arabinose/galactoside ABC-type transport system permease subunit
MLKGRAQVFQSFGPPDVLAPLHHRAIPSDWELGVQKIVRGVAKTPLFWPWIYLVLGALAIFFARKSPLFRNLAIAGIAYQVAVLFTAPSTEYRYAHWLVTAVTIALVAVLVARRSSWRLPSPS